MKHRPNFTQKLIHEQKDCQNNIRNTSPIPNYCETLVTLTHDIFTLKGEPKWGRT